MIHKNIYIPDDLNKDLKQISDLLCDSESNIVRIALREYLEKNKVENLKKDN